MWKWLSEWHDGVGTEEDDEGRYRSGSDVFAHEHFVLSGELWSIVVHILYFDVNSYFGVLVMSTWKKVKHLL